MSGFMSSLRTQLNNVRDRYTPARHHSNFRGSGQLSPEEFIAAGDYLVYKFPSWSWSSAAAANQQVSYLPEGKQYLVTRGVPCRKRLGGQDVTMNNRQVDDVLVADGQGGEDWLSAGDGLASSGLVDRSKEVKSVDDSGAVNEADEDEDEDDIPDMEDDEDDDEAIIRNDNPSNQDDSLRTYNLYIMYSPYYRTPRLYLSGYSANSSPLPPEKMMQDIVGDYKDKTVTLEPFPFVDSSLRMASVHPCRHANVMKVLLDRADAALVLRLQKIKAGKADKDLAKGMQALQLSASSASPTGQAKPDIASHAEGWEVLEGGEEGEVEDDKVAIRVDQYLVVFLKFMASVTPGIEHDFTMSV